VGEGAAQALDAKIVGMARLVRSDNEKLAEQIASDQEASKQALRAMKELQASLPVEVIDSVERRMETLAESVQKANEMLAQRIDRMAEKIGERQDSDIQVVIDRMGDAMHALAGLGRGGDAGGGSSSGGVGTAL
jgi:DNA anti-recombination protein RmuC